MTPRVLVIGAGLVGSSLGMALSRAGADVVLEDIARSHALVAASLGAGRVSPADEVDVVVVATPPAVIAHNIVASLDRFPTAVVTDVGSVKETIAAQVVEQSAHAQRYVPSHPMAGSQFTGPLTASSSLFEGRTWVITPLPENSPAAVAAVRELAELVGAQVVELDPARHDEAVAQVSHVPHLMSILTAAHLREVPLENLQLAGQGIRDVTRIAGSDPIMWRQILSANATAVRKELTEVATDLETLIAALDDPAKLEVLLGQGRRGARSLLGKHGHDPLELLQVTVAIPDEPMALGRLFGDVGELGYNVEDFELAHDMAKEVGYLTISVEQDLAEQLRANLVERGWQAWANSKEI